MRDFGEEFEARLDLYRRDPRSRLIMRAAIRFGVRPTEVRDGWGPDDLAAFAAYEAFEAEEEASRCPRCGVRESDMVDPETRRPLDNPRFKFVQESCWTCGTLSSLQEDIGEKDRARLRWTLKPRFPGDDLVEE